MEDLQEPIISKGGISLILIMEMEGGSEKINVQAILCDLFGMVKASPFRKFRLSDLQRSGINPGHDLNHLGVVES